MKKLSFLLMLVLGLTAQVSMAQDPNAKVTTGVIAFDGLRYDEALEKFTQALSNKDLLKPKNLAKANFFLMQSYLRVMADPTWKTKLEATYPNMEERVYNAFTDAKATLDKAGADKNSYENGLKLAKDMVFTYVYNKGASIFMGAGQVKDSTAALAQYKTSLGLLTKALDINPDNRTGIYILGYAQLMTKDTLAATKSWEKALDNYVKYRAADAKAPKDSNMINVYLNLADVYMNKEKNTQKALDMLAAGKKEFPNHPDIEKNELSVYQRDPSFLSTAITKFEENLQKNPGDTQVRLAYASLLESANKKEQAIEQYKTVLKADPNNFIANANMGAFYVNTAAAISQQLKDSKDDNAYEGFTKGIADNFKLAYPYIKKAQELKPKEVEWVEQMIQITSFLMADPEMEKEMNKYYEMKKALQK